MNQHESPLFYFIDGWTYITDDMGNSHPITFEELFQSGIYFFN